MTNTPTYVQLEHDLALLMSRQEASGFRFDLEAAERIKQKITGRFDKIKDGLTRQFFALRGELKIPKVNNKTKGYQKGCPYTTLVEFNPTSRVHIATVLKNLGVVFEKETDSGQTKVDADILTGISQDTENTLPARKAARRFALLLQMQKYLGQLSEGANAWIKKIEDDGCIHHSCVLATQTGRNAHRSPNLGQVVSAGWARRLFIPQPGHVLVGVDLEGLELRCLGHYLAPYDGGAFADVVVNGDVHQQNADRVGCTRKQVKNLTYGFVYGAGDLKLGTLLYPTHSDSSKRIKGKDLRQKFLAAIPGLEPLINEVRNRIKLDKQLTGLDGRPIFCSAEHAGLNYLLQGAGAIVSKRWVVLAHKVLDAKYQYGVDYTSCAYVHDEIQLSVRPDIADDVVQIILNAALAAGEFYNFRVPITADGSIGTCWGDTH